MGTHRQDEDLGGVTLRQLLALRPTAGPDQPVWLPDGSGILIKTTIDGRGAVRKIDPSSGAQTDLAADLGNLPFLSTPLLTCSPDGRWLAYVGDKDASDDRERSSRVEIRIQPLDGGPERQLTHIGANINAYSWAPDGSSIVFSANRFGRYDIYKVAVPSGETVRLTDDTRYEVYPVFTADGAHVVYVRLNELWTDHTVVVMTADGAPVGEADMAGRIAAAIALARTGTEEDLATRIGTSVASHEAVPAAFGVVVLAKGDPWQAGLIAANIGDDTDTIGAIACAMAGACAGLSAFPPDKVAKVVAVNRLDLDPVATGLLAIRERRLAEVSA